LENKPSYFENNNSDSKGGGAIEDAAKNL